MSDKKVTVKLTKSLSGRLKSHIATARGLGLRKINQESTLEDTPSVRGMIAKIYYMLEVK